MGTDQRKGPGGTQEQNSRQSGGQGGEPDRAAPLDEKARAGIGSSQGQDRGQREGGGERPSAGTADIERGSAEAGRSGSTESLVNDSTGAYKERP